MTIQVKKQNSLDDLQFFFQRNYTPKLCIKNSYSTFFKESIQKKQKRLRLKVSTHSLIH